MSESLASIDELLRYEEEPPRGERTRSGLAWWAGTALIAGALTAVTIFGLRLIGIGVSIPIVFVGFLALLTLRRVTRLVAPPPLPRPRAYRSSVMEDGTYNWGARDALRTATQRWERRFGWAQSDVKRFARTVQPALGELVDERLRQRHGLTRASDPTRARALLGDPLWNFLTTPATRRLTPRECAMLVGPLEKL